MSIARRWHELFDRTVPNMALRIACMFLGLASVAFAVALSRSTGLGTSVISCIPAVLSFMTPISMGVFTAALNILFVFAQIALLRRDFKPLQLLCIPFVLVFAVFIDLFVPLCELIPMSSYPIQLLFSVIACFFTAFGIWIQVKSALILLPGDGIVLTISRVFGTDFAKTKIAFDTSNVVIGVILSLATMGGLFGVREGTIIMALLVGPIIKMLNKLFPRMEYAMPTEGHLTLTADEKKPGAPAGSGSGKKPLAGQRGRGREHGRRDGAEQQGQAPQTPLVITISRQYGSGGREIGRLVSQMLQVPMYDQTLIGETARESGLTPAYVKAHEEDVRRGILYNLFAQNYAYIGGQPKDTDILFLAQAKVITKLADEGSCVLVGRNAGFILKDRPATFNVYVHAPLEARIKRVVRRERCSEDTARQRIQDIDHERASYSLEYTGKRWGDVRNYHLSVDSSIAEAQEIATLICTMAKASVITC